MFRVPSFGIFTYDKPKPLRLYTFYIINIKSYGVVAMLTVQQTGDVPPEKGKPIMKGTQELKENLASCQRVNTAVIFTADNLMSVPRYRLVLSNKKSNTND